MIYCKECDSILSSYEEQYLKDICTNCVDDSGTEDDFDFNEVEELNFND